jgi:hypothetical protein
LAVSRPSRERKPSFFGIRIFIKESKLIGASSDDEGSHRGRAARS